MKIYLAIPYSFDPNKSFEVANRIAADLMSRGDIVISPISHSHPIANYLPDSLRTDSEWWMKQDLPLIDFADEVHVVCINGMRLVWESKGVQMELEYARKSNKPVKTIQWLLRESTTTMKNGRTTKAECGGRKQKKTKEVF